MRKVYFGLVVLLFAMVLPSRAEAVCNLPIDNFNPTQTVSSGGRRGAMLVVTAAADCDEYVSATRLSVTASCTPGAGGPPGLGGSWCFKHQTNPSFGATSEAYVTLACNTGVTGYAKAGVKYGGAWHYGSEKSVALSRICGAGSDNEEDCEAGTDGYDWSWSYNACMPPESPILISTGKDKPGLKDYLMTSVEDGVLFDIDNDGAFDQMAWTKKNAPLAFLALDRNGNGRIDGGFELFGNRTAEAAAHGFAALATLTGESVQVDATNPFFASLLLWTDVNHNGQSEPEELRPLSSQFSAIYVVAVPSTLLDRYGNRFAYIGLIEEAGSRDTRVIYDVFLKRQ